MPAFGKRRALGQHFLRDPGIIRVITETAVDEARKEGCKTLLEIGPGKGAITLPLLSLLEQQDWNSPHIHQFILAERDTAFAENWTKNSEQRNAQKRDPFHWKVCPGDFLDLPDSEFLSSPPLGVVSNLPYSAGTAIVTRLARLTNSIPVMVLMFQAEVAARLRAEQGTKGWGSLSIWIQNQWDVTKLCAAPPRAFAPPPDVDSEVVILRRRAQPRIEIPQDEASQKRWDALLKACFAHRRKMLRSGLSAHPQFIAALERSGIDPTLRAEALTWHQWKQFYAATQ